MVRFRSVRGEVRAQFVPWYESSCLAKDGAEGACVHVPMPRHGERLETTPGRAGATELDMAATLGLDGETEPAENVNDLVPGEDP